MDNMEPIDLTPAPADIMQPGVVLAGHTLDHLRRWCISETFVKAEYTAMAEAIVAYLAKHDAPARQNMLHLGWPTLYQLAREGR